MVRLSGRRLCPLSHSAGPRHFSNLDSFKLYNDSVGPVSLSHPSDGEKATEEQFANLLGSHRKVMVELGF